MFNKLEIRNSQGELLSLELNDVSDGIVLQDVQGLGPVKATIASSGFAKLKGKQVHAKHVEERNILLELGLKPDYFQTSVQDLRDRLYDYFMPDNDGEVKLKLYRSEGLIVDIDGVVESCDPSIFTKNPHMNVSIYCEQPDFVDLTPVILNGNTTSGSTETTIAYPGNVSTGMIFTLNVNRTLTQFTFYLRTPNGMLSSLDFAASLTAGDVVTINTIPGSKGATLLRSSVTSSLLYAVSPQSNWHQLKKGNNAVRVYAEGAAIPYSITYLNRYGGL